MWWLVLPLLLVPAQAQALWLQWDRSSDEDFVLGYKVYACWTLGCAESDMVEVPDGLVIQTDPGIFPTWIIPADKTAGRCAVTAFNSAGESGKSNSVTFGDKPFPRGLRLRHLQ